jgi:hypothetical protein
MREGDRLNHGGATRALCLGGSGELDEVDEVDEVAGHG